MKDNKRNIDQFFQEELGGYTEVPPALVWENLDKRLDGKSSKKPKMFWWLYLLVAAVFIGGSMAAYFNFSKNQTNNITRKTDSTFNSNGNISNIGNGSTIAPSTSIDSGLNNEVNGLDKTIGNNGRQQNLAHSNDHLPSNNRGVSPTVNASENQNSGPSKHSAKAENSPRNASENSKSSNQSNSPNLSSRKKSSANSLADNDSPNNSNENVAANSNTSATNANNLDAKDGQPSATSKRKATSTKNNATNNFASNSGANSKGKGSLMDNNQSKGQPINPKPAIESKPPFQVPTAEKSAPKKQLGNSSPKDNANYLIVTPADDDDNELANEEAAKEKKSDFELDQAAKDKLKNIAAPTAKKQNSAKNVLAAKKAETNDDNDEEDDEKEDDKNQDDSQDAADQEKPNNRSSSGGGGGGGPTKKDKVRKSLNLAIGLKAGYETGYQNITARKNVASIFMEVALSNRINFILQPSIKFGTLNRQISGGFNDTFYNAGDVNRERVNELDSFGKPTGFSNYYFSQNIDSLRQSASSTNKLMEIEVPFLFRYKVDKNFSVLAGINFLFGKTLGFNSSENRFSSSNLKDSVRKVFDTASPVTPGRFLTPGISGKTDIPSEYASPTSPVRFGYTLGLSYVFKEKLMIDFLVQQNLSGTSNLSNDEVRKVFEQPYVRLSLGYVLFGKTKK